MARAQQADQAHLAIEGLRNLLNRESAKVSRNTWFAGGSSPSASPSS